MQMTLNERERAAYISGDTALAELFALAAIGEECEEELAGDTPKQLREQLEEAEAELENLREQVK